MNILGWIAQLLHREPKVFEIKRMPIMAVADGIPYIRAVKTRKSQGLLSQLLTSIGLDFSTLNLERIEKEIPVGSTGRIERQTDGKLHISIYFSIEPRQVTCLHINISPNRGYGGSSQSERTSI